MCKPSLFLSHRLRDSDDNGDGNGRGVEFSRFGGRVFIRS